MKIRTIIIILSFFTVCFFKAQGGKLVEVEKLGWSMNMPNSFNDMTKKAIQYVETKDKSQNKAEKPKTEKTEDIKFEAKNNTFFMLFCDKNKTADKVAQAATVHKNTDELIESIKKTNADAKFTKSITKEEIGKTSFYKTFIKVDLGNNVLQNYIIYNAIINGYNASFCIIYLKETSELTELLNAFKDSKFN